MRARRSSAPSSSDLRVRWVWRSIAAAHSAFSERSPCEAALPISAAFSGISMLTRVSYSFCRR